MFGNIFRQSLTSVFQYRTFFQMILSQNEQQQEQSFFKDLRTRARGWKMSLEKLKICIWMEYYTLEFNFLQKQFELNFMEWRVIHFICCPHIKWKKSSTYAPKMTKQKFIPRRLGKTGACPWTHFYAFLCVLGLRHIRGHPRLLGFRTDGCLE